MTSVAFLDLPAMQREIETEIRDAIQTVISGARYANGPAVVEFEHAFGDYVGAYHCIGVNSGTSALHLALVAGDVGPGDEVITTPMTWVSTAWAISYVGAKPVFVDIETVTVGDAGNTKAEQHQRALGETPAVSLLAGLGRGWCLILGR